MEARNVYVDKHQHLRNSVLLLSGRLWFLGWYHLLLALALNTSDRAIGRLGLFGSVLAEVISRSTLNAGVLYSVEQASTSTVSNLDLEKKFYMSSLPEQVFARTLPMICLKFFIFFWKSRILTKQNVHLRQTEICSQIVRTSELWPYLQAIPEDVCTLRGQTLTLAHYLVSTDRPGGAKDLSFSILQPLELPARTAMPGLWRYWESRLESSHFLGKP